MLPILKKLYRFNILNKPGESFQGITVTEEAFQNAVQEYEKERESCRKSLTVFDKNKQLGRAYLAGKIKSISSDAIQFECGDKNTMEYLNSHEETAYCFLMYIPLESKKDYSVDKIKILDFVYLPFKPEGIL